MSLSDWWVIQRRPVGRKKYSILVSGRAFFCLIRLFKEGPHVSGSFFILTHYPLYGV